MLRFLEALFKEQRKGRKPNKPAGWGGYRCRRIGTVRLDRRQKTGVPALYAELIERNKYAPGYEERHP